MSADSNNLILQLEVNLFFFFTAHRKFSVMEHLLSLEVRSSTDSAVARKLS